MTETPTLTMADVDAYLTQLVLTVQVQDSLISDLLQCMVAIDAESVGRLRQMAAAQLGRVHETRWSDPDADENEFLHRTRFCAYDKVLARAGNLYRPCEIITLDAARRS